MTIKEGTKITNINSYEDWTYVLNLIESMGLPIAERVNRKAVYDKWPHIIWLKGRVTATKYKPNNENGVSLQRFISSILDETENITPMTYITKHKLN